MTKRLLLVSWCLLAFACGDDDATDEMPGSDSGMMGTDSGPRDTGTPGEDSSPPGEDSGMPGEDSGMPGEDSGTPDEDGGTPEDAGMTNGECPDLMPTSGDDNLVISQIRFNGGDGVIVELFNPTSSAITSSTFQLCQFGSMPSYVPVGSLNVAAGEYVEIEVSNFRVDAANTEIALYRMTGMFGARSNMVDYVCWGGPSANPMRKSVAEQSPALWSGACAANPSMNAIRRRPSTAGTSAADYDVTSAYEEHNCD